MITKFVEGTRNCIVDDGHAIHLEYYLTETKSQENSNIMGSLYGIEIVKKDSQFRSEFPIESDSIIGISKNKERVKEILNQLIAHTVTPITLIYMIEDCFYKTPPLSS